MAGSTDTLIIAPSDDYAAALALAKAAHLEIADTPAQPLAMWGAFADVDCKEIVQHRASAKAVPIVEVSHPLAHITHEAAIGSVDSKQLQTLMSRGLTEDEATDLFIEGLLS